jgi:PAS domain S-box-containing protein
MITRENRRYLGNVGLISVVRPYLYILFPVIIWAGIRFTERAVTLITLIITVVAIGTTARGLGPFATMPLGQALNTLQSFTIISAATGLIMSATMCERRQAEEGNDFLASLVASADECIVGKTLDGVINTWNKGAERLFGYSAAEAIGQHISIIIPRDKQEEEDQIMARIRNGQRTENLETTRMNKNGRRINVSLSISPIFDSKGKIVGASKIGHDITGRIATEMRLLAAHQYQQTMINHIPDPIFMKDRNHRWIGGNKSFWEFMKGPPEKYIGKTDHEFFPKEQADAFWEKDDRVFNSGEMDISEEFFTGSDGMKRVLSTKKVSFQDENGEPFLVGIIRDITDLKQKEIQLLKYTEELKRSNQELDDFAYIASHDLKEPLRGLLTQTSFLLEDYQDKLEADGARRLRRLMYLSQRMEKLISDLLYFSRLGRTELAIQETDPNQMVGDIRLMMETFLKERNARVIIPQPMPRVVCDKLRIAEVFRNLIINAVKYSDKPERVVEVGYIKNMKDPLGNETDAFYVKDNGIGIAPEFHEAIFRIFKRLDNPTVNHEEGTGSGLTFVKKIIERHKGKIWLSSEPGVGTTFYFTTGARDA